MAKRGISPEVQMRAAAASREVNRLRVMAGIDPERAAREAHIVEDASARASALTAVGKRTRDVGLLSDARDIITARELPYETRVRKLAHITFAAVGIKNAFAAETTGYLTGRVSRSQLRQQLSLAMTPSVKTLIEEGEQGEFNEYPDLVIGSFYESAGYSNYFGLGNRSILNRNLRAPRHLVNIARIRRLDPVAEGAVVRDAFLDNPDPQYFKAMADFVDSHTPVSL